MAVLGTFGLPGVLAPSISPIIDCSNDSYMTPYHDVWPHCPTQELVPTSSPSSVIADRNWAWILLTFSFLCILQIPKVTAIYLKGIGNVPVAGPPTVFGHWWTALCEHFSSVGIIRRGYLAAPGKVFAVPGLARYKVFISSDEHLDDLANSDITQLSFNDAIFDVFRPHIIFRGFDFDPRKPRPAAPIRALQVDLTKSLTTLTPTFENCVASGFLKELGASSDEWKPFRPQAVCQRVIEHVNNLVIAGERLGSDPEFLKKSMQYTRDVVLTSEVFRFTPVFLRDLIGDLIMKRTGACDYIYQAMVDEMTSRVQNPCDRADQPVDFLQWLLNSSRDCSPKAISRLSQNGLGMIFGGAHQSPMLVAFALYNLCKLPEYLEPLREEIKATEHLGSKKWDHMHLMDSFLKETARLQPSLAFTVPRKVNSAFTFSDGTTVPTGNWICVPGRDLMRDPQKYSDPETFQGFRFAPSVKSGFKGSLLTDPAHKFPFWGSIKRPCPGRFYAALVTKIALAEFVANCDMKLEKSGAPMTFVWGFNYIPHPLTRICIRKRQDTSMEC